MLCSDLSALWRPQKREDIRTYIVDSLGCTAETNAHCKATLCCVLNPSVVSNSSRPCELQPTRLLCLWDSPGKNTGVGCQALLQGISPIKKNFFLISKWLKIIKRNEFCWYFHLRPSHTQNEEQVTEFAVLNEMPRILDCILVSRPSPCCLGMDLFYVRSLCPLQVKQEIIFGRVKNIFIIMITLSYSWIIN